jgi:hypothetical protein
LSAKNGVRLRLGPFTHCLRAGLAATVANLSIRGKSLMTTLAENKAIAGRWSDAFWGKSSDPDIIEELASPDLVFQSVLHLNRPAAAISFEK